METVLFVWCEHLFQSTFSEWIKIDPIIHLLKEWRNICHYLIWVSSFMVVIFYERWPDCAHNSPYLVTYSWILVLLPIRSCCSPPFVPLATPQEIETLQTQVCGNINGLRLVQFVNRGLNSTQNWQYYPVNTNFILIVLNNGFHLIKYVHCADKILQM